MTSALVGTLILIVGAGAMYYLFTQRWTELFLTVVIDVGIIVVLFASVIVQETCDSIRAKIKTINYIAKALTGQTDYFVLASFVCEATGFHIGDNPLTLSKLQYDRLRHKKRRLL